MDLGMSFNPSQTTDPNQRQQDQAGGQTPIQDAIKLLSLRIPQFRSQGGVASLPLLQGSGSLGVMGGNGTHPGGLQQILAQMFGQQGMNTPGMNTGSGGIFSGSAPTPNVIIGANGQSQTGQTINEAPQAPIPTQTSTIPHYPHSGGEQTVPVAGRQRF